MSGRDSPFSAELEEAVVKPRRELVDQPRDEALRLAQAPASVEKLPMSMFRDFDKKVEVRSQTASNSKLVFSARNDSVDFVEVVWRLSDESVSVFSDFDFDPPGASGRALLAPKTKDKQFLTLTGIRPSTSFPKMTFRLSIGNSKIEHDLDHLYAVPLAGDPRVSQGFNGSRSHTDQPNRFAVDFDAVMGTNVVAARGGLVVAVDGSNPDNPAGKKIDSKSLTADENENLKGNYVLVRHDDFTYGIYQHLKQNGIKVTLGSKVKEKDLIGLSGNSGISSGPHLHFAILTFNDRKIESVAFKFKNKQGKGVDPQESKRVSEWAVDEPIPEKDEPLIKDDL
jgi:murein DD-endopeptidase MepM/ murein hydrolase activator NlpD